VKLIFANSIEVTFLHISQKIIKIRYNKKKLAKHGVQKDILL